MGTNNKNRRDFLKLLGMGSGAFAIQSPLELLVGSIMDGLVNKAMAATTGVQPRNYIFIQQSGANPRWTFDLILTPYTTTGFVPNAHVGTRYTGTPYNAVEYATYSFNHSSGETLNLPWLWQFNVPTSSGGTRPMTDLLDHFLSIRGVNTNNPGHPGSQEQQFRPIGAANTTAGLVSEQSTTSFPAINLSNSNFLFSSPSGNAPVRVSNGGNMLQKLLDPFLSANNTNIAKRAQIESSIQQSLSSLEALAESEHPGAVSLNKSLTDAESLLTKGFSGLNTDWTTLYDKYLNLTKAAADNSNTLVGINDKAIGASGTRDKKYAVNDIINNNADLRTMIQSNTQAVRMAQHFAVAEYVIKNDLSNAIHLSPTRLTNLLINTNVNGGYSFDEHTTGSMTSLLINSMYHRALAACLLEFITQLKNSGKWDETVIHMGGEFNRSPKNDGLGSDHGYQGASATILSGAIKAPLIIGNVKNNAPSGGHNGSWGYGASNGSTGILHTGHVGATLASLLRTPSPVTAVGSLINIDNAGITSKIGKGQQV